MRDRTDPDSRGVPTPVRTLGDIPWGRNRHSNLARRISLGFAAHTLGVPLLRSPSSHASMVTAHSLSSRGLLLVVGTVVATKAGDVTAFALATSNALTLSFGI